ncbi:hypothetical protein ACFSR6_00175 [Pedobacter vanadiisoli]|uniref:SnoaL-like domain-containing protein n=1 Tax=Pedobacter vanadiisoli TaxID=1761975 RepID=A0ABW5MCK6_9SPHI
MSPEVNWSQPGNKEISGLKGSQREVFGMVGKMFEISGNTLRLDAYHSICLNGQPGCVRIALDGREKLDVYNTDIYTVENGKICNVEIFSADQAQEDGFLVS